MCLLALVKDLQKNDTFTTQVEAVCDLEILLLLFSIFIFPHHHFHCYTTHFRI